MLVATKSEWVGVDEEIQNNVWLHINKSLTLLLQDIITNNKAKN